jgi:hypothetical protein
VSLPREVFNVLSKLIVPCEYDRSPARLTCDLEATHTTPAGALFCTGHAQEHNERIMNNRFIRPDKRDRYLAVERTRDENR